MEKLTTKNNLAKIHTEKDKNISCGLQRIRGEKETTSTRLRLIKYTRNVQALIYYIKMTKYNKINEKLPRVTII